jgi:hypothetical protein
MQIEGLKARLETAKQIIALSTGAVAFTVTFIEKFTHTDSGNAFQLPWGLYTCWALFGAAIVLAMWYLLAITGSIEAIDRKVNGWPLTPAQQQSADGDDGNLKFPGVAMLVAFLAAVIMMIVVGMSIG